MSKSITRDGKRHHKTRGTTLWFVYLDFDDKSSDPLIVVSNKEVQGLNRKCMRIRTLTAKAAGRKFIRDNLIHQLAIWNFEVDNFVVGHRCHTVDAVEKWMLDKTKAAGYQQRAKVKVVKQ
jgi:hypothetical protein